MRHDIEQGGPADASSAAVTGAAAGARGRLSWRGLARLAALADLLVLAVVGIGRSDLEAVAIAVLLLVAAALAGWRRGLVGLVLLGLLFVDVTAFMLPAAVSNAGAGEALGGVALPAVLAATSLTGLAAAVAAVVALARRGRTAGRTAGPRGQAGPGPGAAVGPGRGPAGLAAGAAAVLLVALGAVAVAGPTRERAAQGSQRLALQAAGTKFSTTALRARPGQVTVSLANHDLFWHTFTIERLGANVDVPVGGTRSVTFTAAPGTYTFVCTIPGHASAGMRGTLVVG
jgi:plastocyanin